MFLYLIIALILIYLVDKLSLGIQPPCGSEIFVVPQICFAEGDGTDKDTYAGCVEGYLSENCHDEICEIMAGGGLPCTNNADTAQGLEIAGSEDEFDKAFYFYVEVCLLGDADVTDETSYLTCIENLVSEEYRDQWCGDSAALGFPCPDADMTSIGISGI